MSTHIQRVLESHGALLCAVVICSLLLCAEKVASKPTPVNTAAAQVDEFALKNPNAFDPARRRSVRAMKEPDLTAAEMATDLDSAEAEISNTAATVANAKQDEPPGKIAANAN